MQYSTEMKIVFRLKGVGFSLSVTDLLHIQELEFGSVAEVVSEFGSVGLVDYDGTSVPIYDSAPLFQMGETILGSTPLVLIISGDNGPYAILIDKVDGIFAIDQFVAVDMPDFFLASLDRPYSSVDIRNGEPLVSFNSGVFSQFLMEAR